LLTFLLAGKFRGHLALLVARNPEANGTFELA